MSTPTGSASLAGNLGDEVGRRLNQEQDDLPADLVMNGSDDIAMNANLDKMVVGVSGRTRCCKIYVRLGSSKGGKTSQSYDTAKDLPKTSISLLPTNEEMEGRPETKQFLVVGIVLAEEPKRFSTTGSAKPRDRTRDQARKTRGTMPSERNVLRALVQTTESIDTAASIKYYVACHRLHGLCDLRLVTNDTIFFFQEVWDEVGDVALAKERRTKLGEACKKLAARDKRPAQRVTVRVVKENQTASNDLQVTKKVNAANIINMQYSLFTMSKRPEALKALKATIENILPDLTKKPSDAGTLAFYDFDEELKKEDAEDAVESLVVAYPSIAGLDTGLVLDLHEALRRRRIGGDLPYQNFALFLRLCHDRATPGLSAEGFNNLVTEVVHDIKIVNEFETCRTASEIFRDEKSTVQFLSGLRVALQDIVALLKDQATALREQHGGLTTHTSIEDIMNKIGDCVDKTALKSLMEQVFAIHAEQLATSNSNGVGYIEECITLIDQALEISA